MFEVGEFDANTQLFKIRTLADYGSDIIVCEAPLWKKKEVFKGAAVVLDDGSEVIVFEGYETVIVVDAAGRTGARRRGAREIRGTNGLPLTVMASSDVWAE